MNEFETPEAKLIVQLERLIQNVSRHADELERSRQISQGDRFVTRYSLSAAKRFRAEILALRSHMENLILVDIGDLAWSWSVKNSIVKDLKDCTHLLQDVITATASSHKATHLKQASAHKVVRAVRLGVLMLEHQLKYYVAAHMAETLEIMEQARHRSS